MKNTRQKQENKNNEEMFLENPFVLAILVLVAAFLVNYLLELDVTKSFFSWCGYSFDSAIHWFNSTFPPYFKDHPYIKIPVIVNPITLDLMKIINPWMWLRGFLVASFAVSQIITISQIKIIKSKNVVNAAILIGILQFCLYAYPYFNGLSQEVLTYVFQKFYINILVLMFVCLVGLLSGIEYALYLFRNDKIAVEGNKNGPDVRVKIVDKWEL